MKRLINLFFVFTVGIFLLQSCSDDSETNQIQDQIAIEKIDLASRDFRNEKERYFFSVDPKFSDISTRSQISDFVTDINHELYLLNQEEEFISQISEQIGDPDWSITIETADQLLWVPLINDNEVNGLFGFLIANETLYFKPYKKGYFDKLSAAYQKDNIKIPLMIMDYFQDGQFNINSNEVHPRSCPPPPCGLIDVYDSVVDQWVNGVCVCSGSYAPPGCCGGGGNTGNELDGGAVEAGGYTIDQWIALVNAWFNRNNSTNNNSDGGGSSSNKSKLKVKLIKDLANEMFLFEWLVDHLNLPIGEWDGQPQFWQVLAGNPQISNPIYLYLNGYYDGVTPSTQTVMALLELLSQYELENNPPIALTQSQIEHILTFEPALIADIQTFLDSHPNDAIAVQVIHDLLDLQMCVDAAPPCSTTNYANEFEAVYQFYNYTSSLNYNWLNESSNSLHKKQILENLTKYGIDALAKEFIDDHLTGLRENPEYKAFVESTFSWSGAMWSIAKELIGDKVVDIVIQFIPGFGNADEIRDAIKAFKNGDWVEFTVEVGKVVVNNTPFGKLLKTWDAVDQMYDFYKKVEKIWDKIGTYAENVIESMWDIVKTYPKALRTNTNIISSIAKTIKRGLKSIDEVMDAIPNFTQMSSARMKHILHGDATGGLHHASGLVNDPTKKVLEVIEPNSKGVYKVRYELPDGSTKLSTMFPDSKSEIGVAKAIENVYNNNISSPFTKPNFPGRRFIAGKDATWIDIEIEIDINNNVLTAYPIFN